MKVTKTQFFAALAASAPISALAVHYVTPHIFNAAAKMIVVEAGSKAATRLYAGSGVVAAVGAVAATAAVAYGACKLVSYAKDKMPSGVGGIIDACVTSVDFVMASDNSHTTVSDVPNMRKEDDIPEAVKEYAGSQTDNFSDSRNAFSEETEAAKKTQKGFNESASKDHFTKNDNVGGAVKTPIAAAMEEAGIINKLKKH